MEFGGGGLEFAQDSLPLLEIPSSLHEVDPGIVLQGTRVPGLSYRGIAGDPVHSAILHYNC